MKNSKNIHIKRQTKIVATIGPATHSVENLSKLINAGLSVARLNMSHGDHKEHGERIKNIRTASLETAMPIGVLVDLSGPKIRTGELESETVDLIPGKKLILTTEQMVGNADKMSVNYPNLAKELEVGGMVMLDDGRRKLQVLSINGREVTCKILIGGVIKPRRGAPACHTTTRVCSKKIKNAVTLILAFRRGGWPSYLLVTNYQSQLQTDILSVRRLSPKHRLDRSIELPADQ